MRVVQVDVFWTYGIGAGFALAAGQQLVKANREDDASPFDSRYFVNTLLFLSILFVPSGACLLWSNPSWETMHAGTYQTIPAWLVVLFCMTNITQGILGYWVTYMLMKVKKYYLAFLQVPLGYFGMFFILVNGWDNQGYQRFFSANRDLYLHWSWSNLTSFLTSDVAIILFAFAPFIIPIILYWISSWLVDGYRLSDDVDQTAAAKTGRGRLAVMLLGLIFIGTLGWAVVAQVLIHFLGWMIGLVSFVVLLGLFGLSKWGSFRFFYDHIMFIKKDLDSQRPPDLTPRLN